MRVCCRFLRILYTQKFAYIENNQNMIKKAQAELISDSIKNIVGLDTKINVYAGRSFSKDIPEFVMLFQKAGKDLFKNLSPGACKVFGYMLSLMQYSNHVGTDQKTFSEELGLSLRTVNGAIKELIEWNVIIKYKDPQDTRRLVYMVNGHAAWKGHDKNRKKHLKENPLQIKMFNE